MRLKGIIFDADGTLLDSMSAWNNLANDYLKKFNIIIDDDVSKKLTSMTLKESSLYLKQKYKLSAPSTKIENDIINNISNFYKYEVKAKKGVIDFLYKLYNANIKLVIVTSGNKELIVSAFRRLGILQYFDKIFSCSELKTNKTSPYIYEVATNYMNLNINEVCVFEDSLYAIKTAKECGFSTIAVEDFFSNKNDTEEIKKIADLYIYDFLNLEEKLKLIKK